MPRLSCSESATMTFDTPATFEAASAAPLSATRSVTCTSGEGYIRDEMLKTYG